MKCLTKDCKTRSLLMTVELCYPCSQLVEKGAQNEFVPDWDTVQPLLDRIMELELKIVMLDEACANCGVKTTDGYALYCIKCSEPLREWVGLTDDEVQSLADTYLDVGDGEGGKHYVFGDVDFARAIEAKLKEKNSE